VQVDPYRSTVKRIVKAHAQSQISDMTIRVNDLNLLRLSMNLMQTQMGIDIIMAT
jgi:hypothetical protein